MALSESARSAGHWRSSEVPCHSSWAARPRLVAYLTVLHVVAEPLRNAGRYTMADVLAYRLKPRPVRAMASVSTLTVSTFSMIAQMVCPGALVSSAPCTAPAAPPLPYISPTLAPKARM